MTATRWYLLAAEALAVAVVVVLFVFGLLPKDAAIAAGAYLLRAIAGPAATLVGPSPSPSPTPGPAAPGPPAAP